MPILIDGYNVLFQSGLLGKGRGPGFLERARHALVRVIAAALDPRDLQETTIVFDSKQAPSGAARQQLEQGVTVLYAQGYDDADALLEELIRRASQPRKLLVVSSDHRVQQAAKRRRARFIGAEEWLEELQQPRATSPPATDKEKPDQLASTEEFNYWRSLFQSAIEEAPLTQSPLEEETPPPCRETKDGVTLDDLGNPFPPGFADPL